MEATNIYAFLIAFVRFSGLLADGPGPVAVVRGGTVWDADRAARAEGVRPGQALAAARAVCPRCRRIEFDPVPAAAALARAWDLLAEASSVVEPDADGRPEALAAWPGGAPPLAELAALAAAVERALPQVELAVGLGPGRLLARAACPPDGGCARVAARDGARLLAARPLGLLEEAGLLPRALAAELAAAGLRRCGQVAELPERVLTARFGRRGIRLRALCLGRDERPVRALYPPRAVAARAAYPDGLPPPAWPRAAADLAREASGALRPAEGACRLRLDWGGGRGARVWKAARRGAGILGRAAAALAAKAARQARDPTDALEVTLEELALIPAVPLRLATALAPPPAGAAAGPVDELLERFGRRLLRRGETPADRQAALAEVLDPGRAPG